ncbi:MAG: glycosyl hydrolase family 8 [Thermovirgaceae bacterium]|nr:glycosyl hydrolase family 8 [Thermovirgaceae bacterium]
MILIFSGVYYITKASPEASGAPLPQAAIRSELEEARRQILKGLDGCLRSTSGLLFTNTEERTFLSETVGLEMMLHLSRGDKVSFDRQVKLLKSFFIGPLGLLPWKIEENHQTAELWNASVDDLRVARALILADRRWENPDYLELARSIGEALLKYNVVDGLLLDGCSWKKPGIISKARVDQVYDTSTLAYADIMAMRQLSEIDPEWVPVLQRMSGVLMAGVMGRDSPWWLFRPDANAYEETDQDDEIIGKTMSLLYLAEAGFVHPGTFDPFASAAVSEKLLDRYGNENISVISLAALFLHHSGRETEALLMLGRLLDFRNDEPALSGLLCYEESEGKYSAWAFDNLIALLAMEAVLGSGN